MATYCKIWHQSALASRCLCTTIALLAKWTSGDAPIYLIVGCLDAQFTCLVEYLDG